MLLDDLACDRQSQTDAAEEIVFMSFQVVETVEDARHGIFGHSDSVVLYRDQNGILGFPQYHCYIAAFGAEFDGIIYERHQGALQRFCVAHSRGQAWVRLKAQGHTAITGFGFISLDYL